MVEREEEREREGERDRFVSLSGALLEVASYSSKRGGTEGGKFA